MARREWMLSLVLPLMLGACSGASSSATDRQGVSGGAGGSQPQGTDGSGAANEARGSGEGKAGAPGSKSSAGSGTAGTQGSGEPAAAGRTATSGTGGTTAVGTTGRTDATGTGTSTGAAGGTGGDAVATGCGLLCSHAGDCPSDTPTKCLTRCAVLGSNPDCTPQYDSFARCLPTAEFGCNDDGLVSVTGCEGPAAAALGCIVGIQPDPELVGPCEDFCDQVAAADCENADEYADCVNGCTLFGATDFPCSPSWNAVLTCSENKTFECDDNGRAVPTGCGAQLLVFGVCVLLNLDEGD